MFHLGKIVQDEDEMRYLHSLEDPNVKSNTIIITMVIKPSYQSVKLDCQYLQFPGDGYYVFSELATVREMIVAISEMVDVPAEFLRLADENRPYLTFDDDAMFHELNLETNDSVKRLNVRRKVRVNIDNGYKVLEYLIQMDDQTIEEVRRNLQPMDGLLRENEKLSFKRCHDSRNIALTKSTRLVDIPYDDVLHLYVKRTRTCFIM